VREQPRCVLHVIAKGAGALGGLAPRLGDGFAHLAGHEPGELILPVLEEIGEARKMLESLAERSARPVALRAGAALKRGVDAGLVAQRITFERLAGGGVDGVESFHERLLLAPRRWRRCSAINAVSRISPPSSRGAS